MSNIISRMDRMKQRLAQERKEKQELYREQLFGGSGAAKVFAALTEGTWLKVKELSLTKLVLKEVRRLIHEQD